MELSKTIHWQFSLSKLVKEYWPDAAHDEVIHLEKRWFACFSVLFYLLLQMPRKFPFMNRFYNITALLYIQCFLPILFPGLQGQTL